MSRRLHFFVRRQREAGCSTDWHAVTAECVTDGRRDRFASNQLTAPLTTQSINQSIDQMKTNNKHAPLSSVPQPRCRSFSRELVRRRRYSRKLQNRIPVHAGKKKNTKTHAVNIHRESLASHHHHSLRHRYHSAVTN